MRFRDEGGPSPPQTHALRVLLVPDSVHWVTGTIARQIARHNAWIDASIVSAPVLKRLIDRRGGFPAELDLVHLLAPGANTVLHDLGDVLPVVWTVHHVNREYHVEPLHRVDAVMTVSREWESYLVEQEGVSPESIVRVPNGVDTRVFRPPSDSERAAVRRRLGVAADALVIGFFGKRSSDTDGRKGTDVFAEAIEHLGRRISRLAVVLVGPGWEGLAMHLERASVRCERLDFVPDHEAMAEVYRALDVYWITARVEGGPVPLLEAMASGLCVVTTPVGMVLDLVEDGENAVIVPKDDPSAFVEATVRLGRSPVLRQKMGECARRIMVDEYDWSVTTPKVRGLYATALRNFGRDERATALDRAPHDQVPRDRRRLSSIVLTAELPGGVRRWITAQEHLAFARDLRSAGEEAAARRLDRRALMRAPLQMDVVADAAAGLGLGSAGSLLERVARKLHRAAAS